jgi:hypothetical protein
MLSLDGLPEGLHEANHKAAKAGRRMYFMNGRWLVYRIYKFALKTGWWWILWMFIPR